MPHSPKSILEIYPTIRNSLTRLFSNKTYYDTLGLPKSASQKEIRVAFLNLSKQHHPDRPSGSQNEFIKINKAYEVLSKVDSKRVYDMHLKTLDYQKPTHYNKYEERHYHRDMFWNRNQSYSYPASEQSEYKDIHRKPMKKLLFLCAYIYFASLVGFGLFYKYEKKRKEVSLEILKTHQIKENFTINHRARTLSLDDFVHPNSDEPPPI